MAHFYDTVYFINILSLLLVAWKNWKIILRLAVTARTTILGRNTEIHLFRQNKRHCNIKHWNNTYNIAMYQFLAAKSAAARKRARPTRVMVGAIASGPIYLSNIPISPLTPRPTSNNDATMIAPCIWHQHKIPVKSYYAALPLAGRIKHCTTSVNMSVCFMPFTNSRKTKRYIVQNWQERCHMYEPVLWSKVTKPRDKKCAVKSKRKVIPT